MFIDDRNKSFAKSKSGELYNIDEIIYSIKIHTYFTSLIIFPIGILLISIILAVLYFIFYSFIDVPLSLYSIITTLVLTIFTLWMGRGLLKGLYVRYQWRQGISDQKIINNLKTQGKVTTGKVVEISTNTIHFEYSTGSGLSKFESKRTFITKRWQDFNIGDEVVVLYAHNVADCLL